MHFSRRLFLCLLWLALFSEGEAWAAPAVKDLGIEFRLTNGSEGLVRDQAVVADGDGRQLSVSRLDFLVSGLALQRGDGTWMESREWYGLVSAGLGRRQTEATGVPVQHYKSIRFAVGLDAAANASDPNLRDPGHPLHPQTAGLHWGWQGGYIFLAAEGHWQNAAGKDTGWSWHVATDAMRTVVELPVDLDTGRSRNVRIAFDFQQLAKAVSLERDGSVTHSRPGDPLAIKLRAALPGAFRVEAVGNDRWQEPNASPGTAAVTRGTPLDLHISTRLPRIRIPEDNRPTVEGTALGRALFHEKGLSVDGTVNCASCHQQEAAFADAGKAVSTGVSGRQGRRNAMPLFNLGWHDEFFWDGRVRGLRHQVLHPIADPAEMDRSPDKAADVLNADPAWREKFTRAFGEAKVTPERIGLALEQYLLTLVSQDSRFDRAARGEDKLTPEEQRGLELFVTEYDPSRGLRGADCFHCHGGNLFTSGQFACNGLETVYTDTGREKVSGNAADAGKFRVPSLRNIAVTAPYMHDGRFATLEAVIDHYDQGVRRSPALDPNLAKHPESGLALTAQDKRALVAFLRTLTDESFLKSPPTATTP